VCVTATYHIENYITVVGMKSTRPGRSRYRRYGRGGGGEGALAGHDGKLVLRNIKAKSAFALGVLGYLLI
jgi:hypothetical protein